MPDLSDINLVGVLVAIVVHQALGFLWYSVLFQKPWVAATGKSMDEMGDPKVALSVGVIASVVMAMGLALIIGLSRTPDLGSGIKIGLLVGVAFVGMALLTQTMFEDRSRTLLGIYSGYQVLGFVLMGAIIGALW